jgi:hypothetical protein
MSKFTGGTIKSISFTTGNVESAEFYGDLAQAIIAAGWKINESYSADGPTVSRHRKGASKMETEEVQVLISAFRSAKVNSHLRLHPKWPRDTIDITVGSKP